MVASAFGCRKPDEALLAFQRIEERLRPFGERIILCGGGAVPTITLTTTIPFSGC